MPRETSSPPVYELIRLAVIGSPVVTFDPVLDSTMPVVYYILDASPIMSIEEFVVNRLPRLLSQLNRITSQTRVELQGQVKGRVDWSATYKSRYGNSFNPTTYVCAEVRHRFDTLENQLLKYLLVLINNCLRQIPKIIREGDCLLLSNYPFQSSISTAMRIQRIETAVRNGLRNTHLSGITLPEAVSDQHLIRAQAAQLDEYRQVADLYLSYQKLVLHPDWEDLKGISRRTLPIPVRSSGEGERWMYLGAQLLREFVSEIQRNQF